MFRKYQLQTPLMNDSHLKQHKHGSCETLTDSEIVSFSDELHEIASLLSVSPSELNEIRFRINRVKMELLIQGSLENYEDAEVFFHQIMKITNTLIGWPKTLKIGAKTKKDPHIRITGLAPNVAEAKKMITTVLDTPDTRVTLKMDVSYTTHSHIIGRGGQSINRVMNQTHCHIHFPDSNRYPVFEKNNQVSISGELLNVEKARANIRSLVPLIFEFELSCIDLEQNPFLKQIQEKYDVLITIRSQPKLNGTLISIKGSVLHVTQVKQATMLVMTLFGGDNKKMNVQMTMEISSQYHADVMGPNGANVRAIMNYTGSEIMFPDAEDPNIDSLKRTTVKIRGDIHSVYLAKQLLVGSLPLFIIFELDQKIGTNHDRIHEISQQFDVNITMRMIVKHNKIMVTIRGMEKNASKIYEARRHLLKLDDEANIMAYIPVTYYMPGTDIMSTDLNTNTNKLGAATKVNDTSLLFHPNNTFQTCRRPIPSTIPKNIPFPVMQQRGDSTELSSEKGSYNIFANTFSPLCITNISNSSSSISPPTYNLGNFSYDEQYNQEKNQSTIEITPRKTKSPLESDQCKLNTYQAKANSPAVRNPTCIWSGRNFLHSSPDYMKQTLNDKTIENNWQKYTNQNLTDKTNSKITNFTSLESNNISAWIQKRKSHSDNLISLLISLGLESYIDIFTKHKIDLETFKLLNEKVLIELGVRTYGPRIKMMTAIKELSKGAERRPFNLAPGAERHRIPSSNTNTDM